MDRKHLNIPKPGRFVSGSLTEMVTKNYEGRDLEPEKHHYKIGVAYSKFDQNGQACPVMQNVFNEVFGYFTAAYAGNQDALSRLQNHFNSGMSNLSLKISDGDTPSVKTGKVNQNTTGCWVFWFSTNATIGFNACDMERNQIPLESIQRGYYVRMAFNIQPNNLAGDRCGLYMNPDWVQLFAGGEVISGGIDADSAFEGAGNNYALPAGAFQLPTGDQQPQQTNAAALPGATPGNLAPAQPQTGHATMPGQTTNQAGVPQQTAYPTNQGMPSQTGQPEMPNPHPQALNVGQQPQPQQTNAAALPGATQGQATQPVMPNIPV